MWSNKIRVHYVSDMKNKWHIYYSILKIYNICNYILK